MRPDRLRDRFFEGVPRYKWLDTIGRGGMGIVFKAQDLELEEIVAIKVLSPDLEFDDQELLLRFKREINLNRKIKHPNVARIHDFGTSGDFPYITMEFVPGKDLRTVILEHGRLDPAHAISILRQIALGSEAAHKIGIIHRDLKSQNVMVEDGGAVAILDFGLARGRRSAENLTLDSIMIGTPHYMSPEQALGKPTDGRSDIYSIGVMGYECLTGKVPFTGDSPLIIAMLHVSEPVPDGPIRSLGLPEELVGIVLKALAKSPDDRFSSAAEMEAELAMVRVGATSADYSAPTPPRGVLLPSSTAPSDTLMAPALTEAEVKGSQTIPAANEQRVVVKTRPPVLLLVDDDANQRRLLGGFLEKHSVKVIQAGTGTEALERLMQCEVDLILMDVQLPDMDGFDTTRVVKSQPATSQIPIILVAARLDRNRFAFGIQSGATDLLAKPLQLEQMVVRVWSVLQHRGFIAPKENEPLTNALQNVRNIDLSGTGTFGTRKR